MILFQMGTLAKWWGPVHSHTLTTYSITAQRHLRNELSHSEFHVFTGELVGQNQTVPISVTFSVWVGSKCMTAYGLCGPSSKGRVWETWRCAFCCLLHKSDLNILPVVIDLFGWQKKNLAYVNFTFFSLSESKNPYAICLTNMGLKKTLAH